MYAWHIAGRAQGEQPTPNPVQPPGASNFLTRRGCQVLAATEAAPAVSNGAPAGREPSPGPLPQLGRCSAIPAAAAARGGGGGRWRPGPCRAPCHCRDRGVSLLEPAQQCAKAALLPNGLWVEGTAGGSYARLLARQTTGLLADAQTPHAGQMVCVLWRLPLERARRAACRGRLGAAQAVTCRWTPVVLHCVHLRPAVQ